MHWSPALFPSELAGALCFLAFGLLETVNPVGARTNLILGCVLFGIVTINCTITYVSGQNVRWIQL